MPCLRSGQLSFPRRAAMLFTGLTVLGGNLLAQTLQKPAHPAEKAAALKTGRAIPLVFEENVGQLPAGTAFAGRTQAYTVQVLPSELRFGLTGKHADRTITVGFSGSKGARPETMTEAGFRTNIYLGNDPQKWYTGIRNYDRVALRELYPGIDAEFYSHNDEIEHDFMLAPGADASRLSMHLAGSKSIDLSAAGDLVLTGDDGALRLHKPNAYQVLADGKRHTVDAEFQLAKNGSGADLGFKLGSYDHSRQLVIDPVITYSTYVAGSKGAVPAAVVADSASPANVYITGTTASPVSTFSGVVSTTSSLSPSATNLVTFVAQLAGTDLGSQIKWLTYYGATGSAVNTQANAIAIQPSTASSPLLFVGGQSNATNLPAGSGTYAAAPTTQNGAEYGFAASFMPANGAFQATAYIEATSSMPAANHPSNDVTSLAADANYVFIGGYTNGGDLGPSTVGSLAVPLTVTSNVMINKGIVVRLTPTLTTSLSNFKTYVAGTQGGNTLVNAIAVGANENIYFAGSATVDFPGNGVYPGTDQVAGKSVRNAFAAEMATTASLYTDSLSFSFLSDGNGDDVATALALDGAYNVFVVGNTTSSNLTSTATSLAPNMSSAPVATHYNTGNPNAGTVLTGFAAEINTSGYLASSTYIADTAAAATTAAALAVDASDNVYITGTTAGGKASFPAATISTGRTTGFAQLPAAAGNTQTQDNTSTTGSRVYLMQMQTPSSGGNPLDTLSGIGYFGSGATTSTAAGVAVDTAAPANAYMLMDDKATTPLAYLSGDAAEPTAPAADGSLDTAYLAQVGFAAKPSSVSIANGSSTPCAPATVGYGPVGGAGGSQIQTASTLTCNWQILANTAANDVVFNFPYSQYLQPLMPTGPSATPVNPTITVNNAAATGSLCKVGPQLPAGANAGITCVVPSMKAGDKATVNFQAQVSSAVNNTLTSGGTFQLVASAYDAQGDTADLTQQIGVAGVPNISITNTATASVYAALSPGDTNNTVVTYTYTVTNNAPTAPGAVPVTATGVTLSTNIGSVSEPFTLSSQAPGSGSSCDLTQAGGCTLAPGASLTYVIKGVYLTSDFTATAKGSFSSTTNAPTVNFNSPTTNTVSGSSTSVSILTQSQVNVGLSLTAPATYNNGFALGQNVIYKVAFTNGSASQATNLANLASASVKLPANFTAGTPTVEPTASATTQSCSSGTCMFTVSQLAGDGGQVVFDIPGSFIDDGTSSDAVAPTAVSGPVTGTATIPAASADSNGYISYTLAQPTGLMSTIYRVNNLSYTTSLVSTSSTVNETNPSYTQSGSSPAKNDTLTYATMVVNSGPSVVRGLTFTIPLPSAANPPSPVASTHIIAKVTSVTSAPTSGMGTVSGPNLVSCKAISPGDTVITCTEADYPTPAGTATMTPAGVTYTVNFTLQFDEQSVAQTISNQLYQQNIATYSTAYALGPDASPYSTGRTSSPSAPNITVQRATNVKSSFALKALNSAPNLTTFADQTDLNLDEHMDTGSAVPPGNNDTLQFVVLLNNAGPDDSAQSTFTINLPGAMRVAIPVGCQLTAGGATTAGVSGDTKLHLTGAGGTMTCTPPSSTTTAGTYTGQLLAGGSCAAVPAGPVYPSATLSSVTYNAAGCYAVYFDAKFVDDPNPANTVITAGTKATVPFSGNVAGNDYDPSLAALTSAMTTVQRAAHVALVSIAKPTYTATGAAATLPTDASGNAEIGQAAPIAVPTTASGSEVYNCVRYTVVLMNKGPNYAIDPTLHYALSLGSYTPLTTTAAATTGVNCVGATPPTAVVSAGTVQGLSTGAIAPTASPAFNLDGFFNINALGATNSAGVVFQTSQFNPYDDYNDSYVPGTTATDFSGKQNLTLVNTPVNDANTTGFTVNAYTTNPSTDPQVSLTFTNVTSPGATRVTIVNSLATCPAVTGAANTKSCYPYGKSPYPPDNSAVRNLYQPGTSPNFYELPTTATVPTTSNTTTVCVTSLTSSLPDIFVKPERALLWVLSNPTSTIKYQTFPTTYPAFAGSLTGDVTVSSTPYQPYGKASPAAYLATPATITFPQIPQAQPASICGSVNGLVNTNTDASAETFGVLEPVNFPPYVVAGAVSTSAAASKGSTASLSDVYVQFAYDTKGNVTKGYTYDYNDQDPCFSAGARTTCSDNPYLAVIGYADINGSTPMHTAPVLATNLRTQGTPEATPTNAYQLYTNLALSSTTGAFVAVADQATGADAHNLDIATSSGYNNNNPFFRQGDFMTADYSALSSGPANTPVCDPGISSSFTYIASSTPCVNAISYSPTVRFVYGGQRSASVAANYSASPDLNGNYFYLGNVGAEGVTGGSTSGGSGLIPLPYPDISTPPTSYSPLPVNPGGSTTNELGTTSTGTSAAIATVTPGQTAGFIWTWLQSQTQAAGVSGGAMPNDTYTLYCLSVTPTAYSVPTPIPAGYVPTYPAGIGCNISTTNPNNASSSPQSFTFAPASSTITAVSVASNIVTITANNSFVAGQQVTINGLSQSSYLNGQTVTVLSTGLSGTQFQAQFTHANMSTTPDTGTATPVNSTSPTIFVTTNGSVYARNVAPSWKQDLGGIALAMLLPMFFFRKRLGRGASIAMLLLALTAAPLLSGCGAGGSISTGGSGGSTTATAAGQYYFRVAAVPSNPAEKQITSAVFEVNVQSAN